MVACGDAPRRRETPVVKGSTRVIVESISPVADEQLGSRSRHVRLWHKGLVVGLYGSFRYGPSGSTKTKESGARRAVRREKLNHNK